MIHNTPQLIQIESFTVMGLSERTYNSNEFNPQTAKIPELWQRFYALQIPAKKSNSLIYGVYSDYESDSNGLYTVTAGIELDDLAIINHFCTVNVKKGNYLVFKNSGPMPKAIIETWQAIWLYFETQSNVIRAYETDFEVYMGQEQCAIYIGVKSF
ncbi:transcriptional regulator [Legionella qingyii]|uniref:Transcriptional regulator n=1 Tax=Legionella qingyii TaxID=2184757 RepID=A0A317U3H0_9GAMM|nr:GyrI-like domain-containing protein [Legionella qingyii]PWY54880.1 transcriptional regulator [Legionella qingyii]RUR20917.1 AraC family transcriptional regulator [Legionella qingyii]RUR23234.1 AraC family transcriptional regulator [Legionella qingyii]